MPKLELTLLFVVAFELAVLSYYLIGKLTGNSIAKALGSLAVLTSTVFVLKPFLEQNPVPPDYRSFLGSLLVLSVFLGCFTYVFSWVRGELEGEGVAVKTTFFAGATGFFLSFFLSLSSLIILPGKSLGFALVSFVLSLLSSAILLSRTNFLRHRSPWEVGYAIIGIGFVVLPLMTFFRRTGFPQKSKTIFILTFVLSALVPVLLVLGKKYFQRNKRSSLFEFDYRLLAVRPLSKVAFVRVLLLTLAGLPVFFVATAMGRAFTALTLVIYVALEGLVIRTHFTDVIKAVRLLNDTKL